MFPVERLHRIKELITEKKNLKIADLSKEFGVSEMTIHRDLKPLVENGTVFKTFGGVSLTEPDSLRYDKTMCVYCHRSIQEKMAYRLILANNDIETTCCAHCGLLRHRQLGDEVIQAICSDFLRQTTISVHSASFVMNTTIDIGCCQPQVLSFEWQEHANNFVKGFGGQVYSMDEAMENVFEIMQGSSCSHK